MAKHPSAAPAPSDDDGALLSAFLDGELDAAAEQRLLQRLEQEPALADALDALAEVMAAAQRALHSDHAANDIDVVGAVLAALPADDLAGHDAADTLAYLLADGAASPAQLARLDTLLNQHPDEISEALAFVDATRATLSAPAAVDSIAAALERLPDHVGVHVARFERGQALAAGAADGALNAAETEELAGLCGGDADIAAVVEHAIAARVAVDGVDRSIGEVLAAFAASPEVERLAARAGAAALQAIAAEAAQSAPVEKAVAPRVVAGVASAANTANTAANSNVEQPGVWSRLKGAFGNGFVPLLGAAAAAVAFVVVDTKEPVEPPTTVAVVSDDARAEADRAAAFAASRDALLASLDTVAMAHAVVPDAAALPVIADNDADVESIDAAGNTVVFQTAESNITVIWVAGLDDEPAEEQGT